MKVRKRRPNPESVWAAYGKMIMKIAHGLSEKYKKPYDELLSEGVLRVFKNLPKWNPERAALCTYVHQCATYGMLDHCIKPMREIPMGHFSDNPHTIQEGKKPINPFVKKATEPNWFQTFLNELTEETHALVKVIFEAPEELCEAIKPSQPKTSQRKLRQYMIDVLDWTTTEVDRAFQEVAQCL